MKYEIVKDEIAGSRINLSSPLTPDVIDFINEKNLKSILLNQRIGWKSQELSLLCDIKDLKCLYLMDDEIEDISVIEGLTNLEGLGIECARIKNGFNFTQLKKLTEVNLDWRPCLDSLHQLSTLKSLRIDKYKAQDLSAFELMPSLERLDIVMGTIQSLKGIERFVNLKQFMIYSCTKLTDISSVAGLSLSELEFESCKKIINLERIFDIKTLENITIDKCYEMNSIADISNLKKLKQVYVVDTSILDGDMSMFGVLHEKGVKVWFTNKKFYSHKLEDFIGKPDW